METRANYVLIGVFTLAVVVGIFAFVWWFQRLGTGEAKATYEIYFDGPVSGLRRGATVNFNGIRVGEVQSLALVPDIPRAVVAIIEVVKSTPIRTDTKVTLEYQGLTGVAAVALTGGDPKASMLMETKRGDRPPRLVAEPTTDAFQAAAKLMQRLDKLVETNEQRFSQIMKDLSDVSRVLATRSNDTLLEVQAAAESIRKAADNLSNNAGPTLNEYRSLASDARRAVGEIDRLVRNIERNSRQFLFNNGGTVPQYNR
ncbi:MAG: MCE family protein [Xanthobacteraceae bacterium]|nr:MCE family protein [Xanthobacteraceae bacterium]